MPEADNQVFEVGGPQLLSMRQIVHTMLTVMGKHRLVLPTPTPFVKLGALVLQRLPGRLLSPRAVDFVNADGDVDTRATTERLGFVPRGLADGIAYLRS
jgi:NADH dehydrogenase